MKRTPIKRGRGPRRAPTQEGMTFWRLLRQQVMDRNVEDQQRCNADASTPRCECVAVGCPHPGDSRCNRRSWSLDAAHIEPLRMGGSRYDRRNPRNVATNLRAMCRLCHGYEERTRRRTT